MEEMEGPEAQAYSPQEALMEMAETVGIAVT